MAIALLATALAFAAPAFAQTAAAPSGSPSLPLPSTQVPAATEGSSLTGTTSAGVSGSSTANIVDINHATREELDSLPDVAGRRAEAIIANRPFKSTDELVSRGILPKNVYDEINDRLVAR